MSGIEKEGPHHLLTLTGVRHRKVARHRGRLSQRPAPGHLCSSQTTTNLDGRQNRGDLGASETRPPKSAWRRLGQAGQSTSALEKSARGLGDRTAASTGSQMQGHELRVG